jgi:hypothetical protein
MNARCEASRESIKDTEGVDAEASPRRGQI